MPDVHAGVESEACQSRDAGRPNREHAAVVLRGFEVAPRGPRRRGTRLVDRHADTERAE